jgi:transglutaminase-like putative cysteine protease
VLGALATLLTACTVIPLVQGSTWLLELLLLLVALVAVGAGVDRLTRHAWAALPAQVATLVLGVTWLYALPEAVLGFLPGPAAVGRLVELVGEGVLVMNESAPPVAAPDGLRLVAVGGIALVALAVDVIAVVLRQPAAAGLPLLAVYCVPAALARGGLSWWWFGLAAVGFLLLVAADSGDRVARWGRVVRGRSATGDSRAPMAATGRRVGAVSVAAAVLVPALVPGLGEALIGGSGRGEGEGGSRTISVVNPMLSLRDDLTANQDVTVLTYSTTDPTPDPLRLVTVDSFDGDTWEPTYGQVDRDRTVTDLMPTPAGLSVEQATTDASTTIAIDSLVQNWLPTPYPPRRVNIDDGSWLYDDSTLNIVGDDDTSTEPGLEYTVQHLLVEPDPEVLETAGPPPAGVVQRWTALPEGLPEVIGATAREVAGTGTTLERAVALQGWFRNGGGFQYSLDAPTENGSSAVADFLDRRSGYCVHFASAMALMARTLGIPARVAVGFLPGEPQQDGVRRVSQQDVHAWPELYFEGAGWMRFEPTPATRTGGLPAWAVPAVDEPVAAPAPSAAPSAQVPPPDSASVDGQAADQGLTLARVLSVLREVPWRVLAGLLVVLLLLAAPATSTWLVRRRRWQQAGDDASRAESAWTTLAERLVDLGVPWSPSLTVRQNVARVSDGLDGEASQAATRIGRAVERARYARPAVSPQTPPGRTGPWLVTGSGPGATVLAAPSGAAGGSVAVLDLAAPEPSAGPAAAVGSAHQLRSDVDRVVGAVAANRPKGHLWRARLMPYSGLQHLRGWLQRAGLRADRADRAVAVRVRRRLRRH